ncbi:uncharacterized protein JN550_006906 [Neoarthrinium moseri]|uniref:uncharacterized protein n=1 Tax=Neoarthrinium moseri TaxID=1658444 RepID=UPI001FDC69A3|nr:uncharacterized protein JN550_006906 [Neoarthrinium moseri]KAI1867765.1 hypothetical protein JN550_006906 [Neoarthrinium moseri]
MLLELVFEDIVTVTVGVQSVVLVEVLVTVDCAIARTSTGFVAPAAAVGLGKSAVAAAGEIRPEMAVSIGKAVAGVRTSGFAAIWAFEPSMAGSEAAAASESAASIQVMLMSSVFAVTRSISE